MLAPDEDEAASGRLLDGLDFGEFRYLQSMFVLIQPAHGFSPLHFVFFRRHSLHALTTLSLLRLVLSTGNCTDLGSAMSDELYICMCFEGME